MTLKNSSSIIKIHEFTGNKLTKTTDIDLSSYNFENREKRTLFDVLLETAKDYQGTLLNIQKIENKQLTTLYQSSRKHKLYCIGNKLIITLDHEKEDTKLITINLDNHSFRMESSPHELPENSLYAKSNSYIRGDQLYQLVGNSSEISLSIKDLKKNVLLNTFEGNEKGDINWKSTPLMLKK